MEAMDRNPPLRLDVLLAHEPLVRGVARAILRGDPEVDDVVQDTWVAALESGPREPRAAPAWLRSVARHRALNVVRERRRRARREEAVARSEGVPDVAEIAEREALRRRLVELILSADEPYRTTLLLRFYEDLPARVVAARLGVSVETVKTRIRRGLDRLRRRMGTGRQDVRSGLLGLAGLGATESIGAVGVAGGAIVGTKTILVGVGLLLLVAVGARWATRAGDGEPGTPLETTVEPPGSSEPLDPTHPSLKGRSSPEDTASADLPRGAVRGLVVDPAGTPVADVSVRVVAADAAPHVSSTIAEPEPRGEGFVTLSGADGTFVLASRPADTTRLLLLRVGYEMAVREPAVFDDALARITLRPGRVLDGRVETADGLPIPVATLTSKGRTADGRGIRYQVASDARGRFRFRYLPAGALDLYAGAAGYEGTRHEVGADETGAPIVVTLTRTALLVHVVDAETQRPIANAGAVLETPDGAYRMGLGRLEKTAGGAAHPPGWLTLLHFGGDYAFPHPRGELFVVAPGYRTERRTVVREPLREPPGLTVEMHRETDEVALAGAVTGGRGVTLEVRVPLPPTWMESGDESLPLLCAAAAEVNGSFALRGIPPGRYRLVVRSEDAAQRSLDVTAPRTDLRIDLSPAGRLVVQVEPPEAVWVHLEQPGATAHFVVRSDAEGRAAFESLPPGSYRATVTASNRSRRLMPSSWAYVPVRIDVQVAPGATTEATLALPARADFVLAVVDESGAGRGDVRVTLNSNPGSYASEAGGPGTVGRGGRKRTGADGRVVYALFPGVYRVELVDGPQRRSTWAHFRREGPATLTIVFPRKTHRITGIVLDADTQEPIAGRRVEVTPADATTHEVLGHGGTDDGGRFEIAGVPAERVTVNVYTNLDANRCVLKEAPYPNASVGVDLTAGPPAELTVPISTEARSLETHGGISLTVTVEDAESEAPIESGFVSVEVLRDGIWFSSSWGRLGADGHTEAITVPRAERYRITVHGGFAADPPYAPAVVERTAEGDTLHLDVALGRE